MNLLILSGRVILISVPAGGMWDLNKKEFVMEDVKIKASVPKKLFEAWKKHAERRGKSMMEVLRSAISTEIAIRNKIRKGGKVLIEDRKGKFMQMVFADE